MDDRFLEAIKNINTNLSSYDAEDGEAERYEHFAKYLKLLDLYKTQRFTDPALETLAQALALTTKAVVQTKALLKDGADLEAADLVLVTAFNDTLNKINEKYIS